MNFTFPPLDFNVGSFLITFSIFFSFSIIAIPITFILSGISPFKSKKNFLKLTACLFFIAIIYSFSQNYPILTHGLWGITTSLIIVVHLYPECKVGAKIFNKFVQSWQKILNNITEQNIDRELHETVKNIMETEQMDIKVKALRKKMRKKDG